MDSLIALAIAALISAMALKPYLTMNNNVTDKAIAATTAGQFKILLTGGQKYADIHSQTLQDTIPVGTSYAPLQLSTLAQEKRIPDNFASTNPYGQQWAVYVSQPVSGSLQVIVLSRNGQTLSGDQSVDVASMTGAEGGYVPFNGMLGHLNAGTAVGAGGSWQYAIPGNLNPGPGHLFGLVASANNIENTSDYLYRNAVANHPELQKLNAPLNMNGNNINNGGDIHAFGTVSSGNNTDNSSVNAYMSSDGRINATKDIRGQVFRPSFIAVSGENCDGVSIPSGNMDGMNSNDSQSQFTTQNGDIARDASGSLLTCSNGTWASLQPFSKIIEQKCTPNNNIKNNSGKSWFVVVMSGYARSRQQDFQVSLNGTMIGRQYNNSGHGSKVYTLSVIVPDGSYFSYWNHVGSACHIIYE